MLLVTPFCNYLHGKFLCNGAKEREGSRSLLKPTVSQGPGVMSGALAGVSWGRVSNRQRPAELVPKLTSYTHLHLLGNPP